ncbi:IclR family transcriptional regulator domain-containing protein [Hydrogenophaga sp. OTU3427]|uniref:IclR family transcriptional regulator domain-containing protein n=1 Tax=Hydrogenophaga sp. OTU3427 TaxID=3043856 RepID=UPI00313AAA0D
MTTPDPIESPNYVRALARGLSVMEALGGSLRGKTLSEVAQVCSLDRATSRRLLLTLCELGYVRAEDSRFHLAPRALSLGYAYLSSFPFWEVARPIMTKVVDELRESCSAATLDGPEAVYVARIRSNHRVVDVLRTVGSRIPAYCTSLGRVLLAGEPPQLQRSLLEKLPRTKFTPHTVTDLDQLMGILADVRAEGWALVNEELEIGLRSLAVPVKDSAHRVVAALNISVSSGRSSADEMRRSYLLPLQKAAGELAAALIARDDS